MEVLVTGGTGVLGRQVVAMLRLRGCAVRVLSRRAGGDDVVVGDLASGAGLAEAVEAVNVVVHCASDTRSGRGSDAVDIEGTGKLVAAAASAGVQHLVYVSIVGVDSHPYSYYRRKRAAEQVVEGGGIPWTIVRATQFFELAYFVLRTLDRFPLLIMPRGLVFQLIASTEVADRVAVIAVGAPRRAIIELGGPNVQRAEDLARIYLRSRGSRKPVLALPVPGRVMRAFREGRHTCPEHAEGTMGWEEFLRARAGGAVDYRVTGS